jgi:predicted GNAT superfamily acetyltransferase
MNGAKPLADNTITLIDASNSTIAISRDREVKEKVAWYTRRVTSIAAMMLTYAKSASLDAEAQLQFQDHMSELKRIIADFLIYLENMSSVDDIAVGVRAYVTRVYLS